MLELKPSSLALAGLAGLVGSVVGSFMTIALVRPQAETSARPEAVAPKQAAPNATPASALEGRLAALERSVRSLSLQDSVARAGKPAASVPITGETGPVDVAPIVDNPVFEAAVRDVMERAEQERTVEREAERSEWRRQASETWASEVTEKLRLTDQQKAKALSISVGFWEKLRGLRQGDGASLPREQWRARMDELRAEAESELAKVLSPAQMNGYRELKEQHKLGSRRSLRADERAARRTE